MKQIKVTLRQLPKIQPLRQQQMRVKPINRASVWKLRARQRWLPVTKEMVQENPVVRQKGNVGEKCQKSEWYIYVYVLGGKYSFYTSADKVCQLVWHNDQRASRQRTCTGYAFQSSSRWLPLWSYVGRATAICLWLWFLSRFLSV